MLNYYFNSNSFSNFTNERNFRIFLKEEGFNIVPSNTKEGIDYDEFEDSDLSKEYYSVEDLEDFLQEKFNDEFEVII